MSAGEVTEALVGRAGAAYRAAGRFSWHFARGKLRGDPVYRTILERGLLAGCASVLDLGAGQGLLASWLVAAREHYASGANPPWPQGWPPPPALRAYTGIEINPAEAARAKQALAAREPMALRVLAADLRTERFPDSDAVVMLDVLHYLAFADQERVLARARAALPPKGRLLLRIGDASAGIRATFSRALDRVVVLARRSRWEAVHTRPGTEWPRLLERAGFTVQRVPMAQPSPFPDVLLQAEAA
ncbi:MAG: class I SAM-dependent methyltransferase [Proteobacteria bacterium]|nr:class I SAM-dependent methyltransferase [Pseudomonadota bacterium]